MVDAPANAAPASPLRRPSNRMRALVVAAAELRRRVGAGDRRRLSPAAGGGDADQVEEAALRAGDDFVGKVLEGESAHERGHIREPLDRARTALAFRHPYPALRSTRWP